MKSKRIVLVLMTLMLVAATGALDGCVRVSRDSAEGQLENRIYTDLADFTRIQIGSAFQLEVVPSDNFSVSLYAGKNFLDKLEVKVDNGTLVIRQKTWDLSFNFSRAPRAVITLPELDGLDLSGAVSATAVNFTTGQPCVVKLSGASSLTMGLVTGAFRADASGASHITGNLTAPSTDIGLSGASSCDLSGTGGDVKIDASGASRAQLSGLTVANADVELSGASTAYLVTDGRIDTNLSGASRLTYGGQPTMGNLDISGSSSLKRVD